MNEFGTVVGRNDFDAFRQALLQARDLRLDRIDGLQRILTARMTMTPPTASPLPSNSEIRGGFPDRFGFALPHRAKWVYRRRPSHRHVAKIVEVLEIPGRTHRVFGLAKFQY